MLIRRRCSAKSVFFQIQGPFSIGLCVANPTAGKDTTLPVHASASSRVAITVPRKPPHRFLMLLIMELVLIVSYPFTLSTGMRFDWFRLLAVLIFAAALHAALGAAK